MDEQLKIIFSQNLKTLLENNGKTQADMCKYMGISSATATDWCNKKKMPRADKLQTLCSWLNCELGDLIGESNKIVEHDSDRALLLKYFDSMNDAGKEEMIKHARLLDMSGEYKK